MELTPAELAHREAALKLQREQQQQEQAARLRDMAALVSLQAFQRHMLGQDGYLAALEKEALEVLADDKRTPLNNASIMAVHLSRWRDLRALRADLAAQKDAALGLPAAAV